MKAGSTFRIPSLSSENRHKLHRNDVVTIYFGKGNAVVGQSGGPTSVINASLKGVIEECLNCRDKIGRLFGAEFGIEGILKEELIELFEESPECIGLLSGTPGAALGGCRYMLKSGEKNDPDILRIFEVFKKYDIHYFFYIGGNDSMDTALKLDEAAKELGYVLSVIGIPKTIDNDLMETDHSPGYGSCARYLINSVIESGLHARSMKTAEPVTILITVGRSAGWLPAACSLARQKPSDPPHLILLPEVAFDGDYFVSKVREIYNQYGFVYIVAGEGLRDGGGNYLSFENDSLSVDAFGHPTLGGAASVLQRIVETEAKLKARIIKPDICQQSAVHLVSGIDLHEAEECGRAAVKLALKGESGKMVTLIREKTSNYSISYGDAPLHMIANRDRLLPQYFIAPDGLSVNSEFSAYLAPLLGNCPSGASENGLRFYRGLEMIRAKD